MTTNHSEVVELFIKNKFRKWYKIFKYTLLNNPQTMLRSLNFIRKSSTWLDKYFLQVYQNFKSSFLWMHLTTIYVLTSFSQQPKASEHSFFSRSNFIQSLWGKVSTIKMNILLYILYLRSSLIHYIYLLSSWPFNIPRHKFKKCVKDITL